MAVAVCMITLQRRTLGPGSKYLDEALSEEEEDDTLEMLSLILILVDMVGCCLSGKDLGGEAESESRSRGRGEYLW